MTMSDRVGSLTLDTLATREDFSKRSDYTEFDLTVRALDRLYRGQMGEEFIHYSNPTSVRRAAAISRSSGRYQSPKGIVATIGWFENQSRDDLMDMRIGGNIKSIAIIEALIERKYPGRYGD